MSAATPVLEVRHISKAFPGVMANRDITLSLGQGEILAVLGENGAGKSTLMNIIYGLYQPTAGEIRLQGQPWTARSPRDAIASGIGMVHQHFQLVPNMTVWENIVLGQETIRHGQLDMRQAIRDLVQLSRQYKLDIDPGQTVENLPVGLRQRVEIVKALYRQARILILDEPTSVLTPQEIESLFAIMRLLRDQGTSIIFITHKLKEVMAIADRIVVLRQGQVAGETTPRACTESDLAAMMVGRTVMLATPKDDRTPGPPVLAVQNLRVTRDTGGTAVQDVSFDLHAGEILGIAGVQGNGQTELIEALTGLRSLQAGRISLQGRDITHASPRFLNQKGAACHVPEDRHAYGMVDGFTVAQNLILNRYHAAPFARYGMLQRRAIQAHAQDLAARFDIRLADVGQRAGSLSGGNQQKMVVAREFRAGLALLIVAQPTRGIDVGSIEFIHRQIVQQRDAGVAVLLASYELDEIMTLSDRIAVMFEGRIMGIVQGKRTDRNQLGLLMAGVPA